MLKSFKKVRAKYQFNVNAKATQAQVKATQKHLKRTLLLTCFCNNKGPFHLGGPFKSACRVFGQT